MNHDTKPTYSVREAEILNTPSDYEDKYQNYHLDLQENEYETYDSWFPQSKPSQYGTFYNHARDLVHASDRKDSKVFNKAENPIYSELDRMDDVILSV